MKRALQTLWLLPRNAVVLLLRGYRKLISPLYGDVCRYYPSCSAYALGAVQEHGVVVGAALSGRRLARCHPWAAGGIDDVPLKRVRRYNLTPFGFVTSAHVDISSRAIASSHGRG